MKYKTLKETPKLRDMSNIKIVDMSEFLAFDYRIPLLVCNQYRIYPDEFQDLKLLSHRKIALGGKTYLSGSESNIEEYFLDDFTIHLLTFSTANLIRGGYDKENKRYLRLNNYWQNDL